MPCSVASGGRSSGTATSARVAARSAAPLAASAAETSAVCAACVASRAAIRASTSTPEASPSASRPVPPLAGWPLGVDMDSTWAVNAACRAPKHSPCAGRRGLLPLNVLSAMSALAKCSAAARRTRSSSGTCGCASADGVLAPHRLSSSLSSHASWRGSGNARPATRKCGQRRRVAKHGASGGGYERTELRARSASLKRHLWRECSASIHTPHRCHSPKTHKRCSERVL